ncbi:MAG: NAD(P)/FAD-dependent oxidoreductase [Thermosynechococcaceae cyanobacterium]
MTQTPQKICILGGGFGGLFTALRLSQLPWSAPQPEITLVDHHDHFLFTPFLYELVTDELQSWEIAPPFTELLANTPVQFVQGDVERIDLATSTVKLKQGDVLSCDRIVLALGGETPKDQVPGAAEHAFAFRTITDAYALESRLRQLEASDADKIRVAIVGAGPSGVELACKLADRLGDRGRLRLIDRGTQILDSADPGNREAAQKALEKRGVWLDLETNIKDVGADQISLDFKAQVDTIPVELVLWTVGNAVAQPIQALSIPRNDQGQIVMEPTLQVSEYPHVYALGDLADCRDTNGKKISSTAQAALQQADCVAWNVWASVTHRPLLNFEYNHLGEMLTLGRDTAALSGFGLQLDGPLAYVARRMIYLYRMPTLEHQLKVGLNWLFKPLLSEISS